MMGIIFLVEWMSINIISSLFETKPVWKGTTWRYGTMGCCRQNKGWISLSNDARGFPAVFERSYKIVVETKARRPTGCGWRRSIYRGPWKDVAKNWKSRVTQFIFFFFFAMWSINSEYVLIINVEIIVMQQQVVAMQNSK